VELVGSTQQRLDVLEQSIGRMSSQAEQHGAVQQVLADPHHNYRKTCKIKLKN